MPKITASQILQVHRHVLKVCATKPLPLREIMDGYQKLSGQPISLTNLSDLLDSLVKSKWLKETQAIYGSATTPIAHFFCPQEP